MIYVSINSKLQYPPQASLRVSELLKIGSFKFPPLWGSNAPPKRRIWYLFFFSKWKNLQAWLSSHWPNFTPRARTMNKYPWVAWWTGCWKFELIGALMDCLDLSAKQQIEQLTFSWVLYFTPFVSWFPVLLSSNSFHFRLSILQIH